jgi:hypothetical protein
MSTDEIKIKMNIPSDVEVIGTVGDDKASIIAY